jgi:hypothetical protein
MSWLTRVNEQELIITTGDRKEYRPLYRNPKKTRSFNAIPFEYDNVTGADVRRGKPSYNQFAIELFFQGDDHLDVASAFMQSAEDTNSWTISHPHYDDLIVEPDKLEQSNSGENVSVITGTVYETIINTNPDYTIDLLLKAQDGIDEGFQATTELSTQLNVQPAESGAFNTIVNRVGEILKKGAITELDLSTINQAIAKADAKLNTLFTNPVVFMQEIADILRTPSKFYSTISTRVGLLKEAYEQLTESLIGAVSVTEKAFYEIVGGQLVMAVGEAIITPVNTIASNQDQALVLVEYQTRREVLDYINELQSVYEDYLTQLGALQSDNDNKLTSYYPTASIMDIIRDAINRITGNLLAIATNAKQERVYVVPEDTPLIVLVHRLYGKTDRETVEAFRDNNDLLLFESMIVKKDRKVVYYV